MKQSTTNIVPVWACQRGAGRRGRIGPKSSICASPVIGVEPSKVCVRGVCVRAELAEQGLNSASALFSLCSLICRQQRILMNFGMSKNVMCTVSEQLLFILFLTSGSFSCLFCLHPVLIKWSSCLVSGWWINHLHNSTLIPRIWFGMNVEAPSAAFCVHHTDRSSTMLPAPRFSERTSV